jgi:hypothetical protein
MELVPPGFDKSYDPSLAFESDGSLLVVGGASRVGRPRCQPGSAIFAGRITSGRVSYFLVQPPVPDTYVDRPMMVRREGKRGRIFVTWTESTGKGAECRGSPLKASRTMFTRSSGATTFEVPRQLPSSGLLAPFGSSIALGDAGRAWIAVGERDPGRLERVVVTSAGDDGSAFSTPVVVGEGPPVPGSISGLGGFVTAVPRIAAQGKRDPIVTWAAQTLAGPVIQAAFLRGEAWERTAPPAEPQSLFPTPAYDGAGRVHMLYMTYSKGMVSFFLTSLVQDRWDEPLLLASGPSAGYVEVGQFLGLSSAGVVAAAVPVNGPNESQLLVATLRTTGPSPSPESSSTLDKEPSAPGSGQEIQPPARIRAFLLAALGAALLGLFVVRARRR